MTKPFASALAGLVVITLGAIHVNAAAETNSIPPDLYRPGEAPVLTPNPPKVVAPVVPSDATIIADYGRAYRFLQRPRIAVYWNRSLTDRISQWFEPRRRASSAEIESSMQVPHGPLRGTIRGSSATGEQYLATDPKRGGMVERDALEFESAFYEPFLNAGTKFVDRAAILRLSRSDMRNPLQRDASPDVQVLETEALKDYADLLLEILLVPDAKAPAGFAFHILVKRVRTGQIVASRFTRALGASTAQPAPKGELVPGPGGFYRKQPPPSYASVADIGKRLAMETMQAISRISRS